MGVFVVSTVSNLRAMESNDLKLLGFLALACTFMTVVGGVSGVVLQKASLGVAFYNTSDHVVAIKVVGCILIFVTVYFFDKYWTNHAPSPIGNKGLALRASFSLAQLAGFLVVGLPMVSPDVVASTTSAVAGVVVKTVTPVKTVLETTTQFVSNTGLASSISPYTTPGFPATASVIAIIDRSTMEFLAASMPPAMSPEFNSLIGQVLTKLQTSIGAGFYCGCTCPLVWPEAVTKTVTETATSFLPSPTPQWNNAYIAAPLSGAFGSFMVIKGCEMWIYPVVSPLKYYGCMGISNIGTSIATDFSVNLLDQFKGSSPIAYGPSFIGLGLAQYFALHGCQVFTDIPHKQLECKSIAMQVFALAGSTFTGNIPIG